jgi:hypothetical protein
LTCHVASIVALICIVGCASSQQQQGKAANEGDERTTNPPPSVVASPEQGQPANNGAGTTDQSPHWYDFLTSSVAADWAIVIVAGLTGLVVGWQAWETRKAANAARRSAVAGQLAQRTSRVIERAYLDVHGFAMSGDVLKPKFRFQISNTGNTPAKVTHSVFGVMIAPTLDAGTVNWDPADAPQGIAPGTLIYKGHPAHLMVQGLISQTQHDQLVSGACHLYIFGKVVYSDRFGVTHHRYFTANYVHAIAEWSMPPDGRNDEEDEPQRQNRQ